MDADDLTDTRPQDDRKAWYLLALLSLGFILSMLDRTVLSLLVEPIKAEFGLSDTSIALLQGASFAIFYALAGVPIGWIADRFNRRNLVASGIGLWSIMTIACGLVGGYALLFSARVGVAVGEAALNPAAYSMLSDRFSKVKLGRAIGIFTAAGVMGSGLALLIGGALLGYFTKAGGLDLGSIGTLKPWQATFVAVGAPGLILAALFVFTISEPQRVSLATASSPPPDLAQFLKADAPLFLPLLLGYGIICMLGYAFLSWAPTSMVRLYGLTPQAVGPKFGIIMLVFGSLGPVLCGLIVDHLSKKEHSAASFECMIAAALLSLLFAAAAFFVRDLHMTLVVYAGIALSFTAILAAVPTTIQIVTPSQYRARVSALCLVSGNVIGLGGGPLIVGLLNDHVFSSATGIGRSLPLVMTGSALAALPLLMLAKHQFQKRP
jgi:MFS family permease